MEITVKRFVSDNDSTLSTVHIDGEFECFGLEDEYREEKVAKETRIPAGTYKLEFRNWGGFHTKYEKRFPDFHKGMLQVMDVPGFTSILIHMGNTDEDTAGCLLVGLQANAHKGNISIGNSRGGYKSLYKKVSALMQGGEDVFITYVDRDRK